MSRGPRSRRGLTLIELAVGTVVAMLVVAGAYAVLTSSQKSTKANDQIASFCQLNYGVSFPMMAKVEVNCAKAHPLWQWLTAEAPGLLGSKAVKWNFTKFLVGRDGKVIKRYAPTDTPQSLKKDIEAALAAKA